MTDPIDNSQQYATLTNFHALVFEHTCGRGSGTSRSSNLNRPIPSVPLSLTARPRLPKSSELEVKDPLRLTGVADLDGPGDLKVILPLRQQVCGAAVATELMGGSSEERAKRYRMVAVQAPTYVEAAERAGDTVYATVAAQSGLRVYRSRIVRMAPGDHSHSGAHGAEAIAKAAFNPCYLTGTAGSFSTYWQISGHDDAYVAAEWRTINETHRVLIQILSLKGKLTVNALRMEADSY
jgi:hypothetical protein